MANPLYPGDGQTERPSGKPGTRPDELGRSPYRKDYARLLHASSFRRLQGKTQLFPGVESDFFRNRLTHSLEVAQVARGIAAQLNVVEVPSAFSGGKIDEDVVEFAAIAHDLGHPPFGHNGELALDALMRAHGGFEGNAQTLRILAAVERKVVLEAPDGEEASFGLDLTYRALASVLKYDSRIPLIRQGKAGIKKGYFDTEASLVADIKAKVAPGLRGQKFKTIECAIMDVADDIAYSTYDLEDSLHAGFTSPSALAYELATNNEVMALVMERTNKALKAHGHETVTDPEELLEALRLEFKMEAPSVPKGVTGAQRILGINIQAWKSDSALLTDKLFRTQFTADRIGRLISAVSLAPNNKFPQLSGVVVAREMLLRIEVLKHLNYLLIIRSPRLAVVEYRGRDIVTRIFEAIESSDGSLMPLDWQVRYREAKALGLTSAKRVICDFVACMTDRYAAELFARLFGEGPTMFKPI
jgi:dGTPase